MDRDRGVSRATVHDSLATRFRDAGSLTNQSRHKCTVYGDVELSIYLSIIGRSLGLPSASAMTRSALTLTLTLTYPNSNEVCLCNDPISFPQPARFDPARFRRGEFGEHGRP